MSVGDFFDDLKKKVSSRFDDTAGLSEKQKRQVERLVLERKLELIAEKRLRDIEKKFAVKEKPKLSEKLAKVKEFRQRNIARRKEQMDRREAKLKRWEEFKKPGGPRRKVATERERMERGF